MRAKHREHQRDWLIDRRPAATVTQLRAGFVPLLVERNDLAKPPARIRRAGEH
jgi:hypothetical protein